MDTAQRAEAYLVGPGPHGLEIGTGPKPKQGWFCTDLIPQHATVAKLDARQDFPLPDSSFDYVYCEHMIEHITFQEGAKLLAEAHRVLKSGGVLRVVTPSIGFILRMMQPDRSLTEEAYLDWALANFSPEAPGRMPAFFFNNFVRAWQHTFIYDRETLLYALGAAGFGNITACQIQKSPHAALQNLENADRISEPFLALESMVLEGQKQ